MTRTGGQARDRDTDAQAALWLARHKLDTIDVAAFEAWRARDIAHAVAFARALALWESVDRALPATLAPPPAAVRAPRLQRRQFLQAASAVLAVGLVAIGTGTTRAYAWSSAATRLGENRTIALPDGSAVALNTDSRLSWRFSGTERSFWIERGEIALDLRAGPAATLHGEQSAVLLSGGQFNARLRGEALDLLVQRGRAQVAGDPAAPQVEASKGVSSMLVSAGTAVIRPADADQVESITAWQKHEILFLDATLGSAVDEYNRFLPRKIVIVDRELANIPVGGRFVTSNPDAFLHAVATGLNVRVSQSPTAYLLTR